jgi:hypothetical protein
MGCARHLGGNQCVHRLIGMMSQHHNPNVLHGQLTSFLDTLSNLVFYQCKLVLLSSLHLSVLLREARQGMEEPTRLTSVCPSFSFACFFLSIPLNGRSFLFPCNSTGVVREEWYVGLMSFQSVRNSNRMNAN